MNENSGQGNSIHGGHVAILLGLLFWVFFVLQPYIDPTPENLPTKNRIRADAKKDDPINEKGRE